MTESKLPRRSSLGLVVLWLLYQEPLHVYRMQKLIEVQAKDRVVNVRSRASLYQAIERLLRLGLVEVHETVAVEGYPDRIVYAITDPGRAAARQWLRDSLRTTGEEFPEFMVGLSIMFGLTPEDARQQLEQREQRLAAELAETKALSEAAPGLPRLFMLEEEYRMALLEAELAWLRGVIGDLRARRLDWSEQWLREIAEAFIPPDKENNQEEQ
ncbi:MAG TPA: PadR family transcriptional regulator [Solirubrobacteraceae bacterium]